MSLYGSTFSVAGMSSSTSSHQHSNLNNWGNSNTGSSLGSSTLGTSTFGDSLSQSRSHYQPGYLMSASQMNTSPQGNQRVDELPVVQTKAKINQALLRGSADDFGMDSMFESTRRQRQPLADEDAPPTQSVNDIPNEAYSNHFQSKSPTPQHSLFSSIRTRTPPAPKSSTSSTPLYVIVYGYPADKYSVTVEYFKSLGETTDADPNTEIVNCFRIGYYDPGEAMRAVRKSGEILGGSWMIGVKWADSALAESVLGQPVHRPSLSGSFSREDSSASNAMVVDEPAASSIPTVGTPIRLAPSASAFRKTGSTPKPSTPQPKAAPVALPPSGGPSPSKGIVGQVSDLIFGW
ncbi:hypothetical protein GYMLUDRAFT_73920 [Collybiopsis luxurians FD-317 M1]|uniref:RRM Nup35-type domain-containing protein n=1 Tax=Collybiopsis luxurians FD-317 M1 TaxID=944289 RepID=A0A0D0BXQ3_9AGAR|nr:hypothetical protein GYMLUDRAFT_73920 [Collybiopsis luxurians FD-317 M1]